MEWTNAERIREDKRRGLEVIQDILASVNHIPSWKWKINDKIKQLLGPDTEFRSDMTLGQIDGLKAALEMFEREVGL